MRKVWWKMRNKKRKRASVRRGERKTNKERELETEGENSLPIWGRGISLPKNEKSREKGRKKKKRVERREKQRKREKKGR